MKYEIIHNGKDITDSIGGIECYSCDRYGGMLDDLGITFSSETNTVEFNENDELEIRTVGGFTTGTMYLDSAVGKNERFTVKALSCRNKNKKRKSKIWNHVMLSQIINYVAGSTGLTPVLYGISNFTYKCVSQIMESDLQMLARICKREGYSIKCDNGNLIIFNEYYLENSNTPIEISKDSVGSNFSFNRSTNGLCSMTVRHFNVETMQNIFYTFRDETIPGGEDVRIEFMSDMNEAQRVAKGYLREANKFYITGLLEMTFNQNISAGTVADLTGFEEFDGRYVVYEVRHDFLREKTQIKVRKVLGY